LAQDEGPHSSVLWPAATQHGEGGSHTQEGELSELQHAYPIVRDHRILLFKAIFFLEQKLIRAH
jgi:hypothetical protein